MLMFFFSRIQKYCIRMQDETDSWFKYKSYFLDSNRKSMVLWKDLNPNFEFFRKCDSKHESKCKLLGFESCLLLNITGLNFSLLPPTVSPYILCPQKFQVEMRVLSSWGLWKLLKMHLTLPNSKHIAVSNWSRAPFVVYWSSYPEPGENFSKLPILDWY